MNQEKYDEFLKEFEPLDLYERGYIDALIMYAWWQDGRMQVGTTGTTLAQAVRKFFESREGKRAQARPTWSEATGEGVELAAGLGRVPPSEQITVSEVDRELLK
jgi:hypothetical protein